MITVLVVIPDWVGFYGQSAEDDGESELPGLNFRLLLTRRESWICGLIARVH